MSEYARLKKRLASGWNTWNVRSVLSHVLLPEAFSLSLGVKEFPHTSYLAEALIAREQQREEELRPGLHAYDGSYTELTLSWKGIELRVESGHAGDDLVLCVTPLATQKMAPKLVVHAGMLWQRPGHVEQRATMLIARLPSREITVHATAAPVCDPHVPAVGPYLVMPLDAQVGVCTGRARTLNEIRACLDACRATQQACINRYGAVADVYEAMQTCLAWDTIYEPAQDRVITPVSRIWSCGAGGYILFCWDTFFAAYMAAVDHPDLACSNLIEMARECTPDGFVPNYAQPDGFKSYDRSQPPVGALAAREIYRRHGTRWALEEVFEPLLGWNRWWPRARAAGDWLAWGSTPYAPLAGRYWESAGVNATYGGALESGLDNSPMYDDVPFDSDRHVMQFADAGLTSLYVLDCDCLADIARVLGRAEEAELRERGRRFRAALGALWDADTGIFLNRRTDTGAYSQCISPTNFYPLLARAASPAQAERMVREHLLAPAEFGGEWVIPSIARNDPAFQEQYYWRGRIWPPMNFLVYLGLRHYDLTETRAQFAAKSEALLLKEWRARRYVCENYCAHTGAGGEAGAASDRFYHWGGLLGLVALIEHGAVSGPETPLS